MEEEMIGVGEGNPILAAYFRNAFLDANSPLAGKVEVYNLYWSLKSDPTSYIERENAMMGSSFQQEGPVQG